MLNKKIANGAPHLQSQMSIIIIHVKQRASKVKKKKIKYLRDLHGCSEIQNDGVVGKSNEHSNLGVLEVGRINA